MTVKRPPTRAQLEFWIEAIAHEGVNLTVWEEQFIFDMQRRVAQCWPFSDKEAAQIERIYAERTP